MREPRYPLPRVIFNFIFVTAPDKNRLRFAEATHVSFISLAQPAPGFLLGLPEAIVSTRAPSGGSGRTHAARLPPRECFNQFASGPVCEATTMILPQVQWTSRDVAGSEPPTSPRSEHFTGPFNR
ncbi:protein TAR1-like [Senna tora]|uniref:Protein TAR1-like n=1 Tax=Senna tora TaxID=362788 RepID=A0A834VYK9_9FABA|nr:protein TAR1-like [Senna tora]